jgi:SAM-dependent methyltransferase
MKEFWNDRYSAVEYVYGTHPNAFFKESLDNLEPGKILFVGEGEGRNAVYAAKQGWEVSAFDSSEVARNKALNWAETNKVGLQYEVIDALSTQYPDNYFDCLVFIFVHPPKALHRTFHQHLLKSLKSGGKVIFEGFAKKQIELNTGGSRNIDMLFSKNDIFDDFNHCILNLDVQEREIELDEGKHHVGKAQVIRFFGRKMKG